MGRADFIGFVGFLYGLLLADVDRPRAVSVLTTSREAFQRLGMTSKASAIEDLLKKLEDAGDGASDIRPEGA
jgi:hypothetical protein